MITNYIYADVAESYRFPPPLERVLEQRARAASVLLGPAELVSLSGRVSSLVLGAAKYMNALAVLPIDPEADHRIERLMAQQPKRGSRKPLPRK